METFLVPDPNTRQPGHTGTYSSNRRYSSSRSRRLEGPTIPLNHFIISSHKELEISKFRVTKTVETDVDVIRRNKTYEAMYLSEK